MLAVDHEQRPGIEVIIRHPLVVRNISELDGEFPSLVEAGEDFYRLPAGGRLFDEEEEEHEAPPELSSTLFTEQYSFNEGYGQRRLSVTGVFTPDLRNELFYSAKRRMFPSKKLQLSDPALYESIRREEREEERQLELEDERRRRKDMEKVREELKGQEQEQKRAPEQREGCSSPRALTQNIFDEVLKTRLHAIRAQESLLQQKLVELQTREQELSVAEKRVQSLERQLQEKLMQQPEKPSCRCSQQPVAPPIPPRKPAKSHHDDTYCTIELNETSPTVAKLNLAAMPPPKSMNTLRKVTFQSPQKFVTYGIENVPPPVANAPPAAATAVPGAVPMQMSVSSNDSGDSQASSTRRKSILSLFGLSRGSKAASKSLPAVNQAPTAAPARVQRPPLAAKPPITQEQQPVATPAAVANLWTKEQKKQAFELLAAMNAAEREATGAAGLAGAGGGARRQHLRQSVRERNSTLQRNRMRRSLVLASGHQKLSTRDQMMI